MEVIRKLSVLGGFFIVIKGTEIKINYLLPHNISILFLHDYFIKYVY